MSIVPYNHLPDYIKFKEKYDNAISNEVMKGAFINGHSVNELETKLSKYINIKHTICLSSGTDALLIALLALDIKPGDEIITTPFTWISTSEVIVLLGAVPVFVDINRETFNIHEKQIENAITNKTKVILPVSLFGQMCNLTEIMQIANKHGLFVVEDAAQSMGAMIGNNKSGSIAHISCTSFYPTKPLGGWGDGGACFTNDDNLAHKMKCIRNHGAIQRDNHDYIGLNSRMGSIIAAVLNIKMDNLECSLSNRIKIAERYDNELKDLTSIILPKKIYEKHVYAQYTILLKNKDVRDKFIEYMKNNQVIVCAFYPKPLYKQTCMQQFYKDCPVTDEISDRCVSLTCYDGLTYEEQTKIIDLTSTYFK